MELADNKHLSESDLNKLPYFFFQSFKKFVNNFSKEKYNLFYSNEFNALMPVKSIQVKSFRLLQITCPPVTLDGERLSEEKEKAFLNDFVKLVKKKVWVYVSSSHAVIAFLMQFRIMPNHAHLERLY